MKEMIISITLNSTINRCAIYYSYEKIVYFYYKYILFYICYILSLNYNILQAIYTIDSY